jgi:hypothetical protein
LAAPPLLAESAADPRRRHLAPCPETGSYCSIASEPRLGVCARDDFLSSFCEEYSPSLVFPGGQELVCAVEGPVVLTLLGLQGCQESIGSVTFNLTKDGNPRPIRYFVEREYPYTVFGDTPTRVYTRRLAPGSTYKLDVTIKERYSGCDSYVESYEFYVDPSCT